MNNKRKLLSLIVPLLVCSSCGLTGVHHEVKDYMSTLEYHDNFKIMQFTDLHFCSFQDIDEDINFFKKMVDDNNPDLLVIDGDLFTFASKRVVRKVMSSINDLGVKFTIVFGNHDEQVYGSYNYISKYTSTLSNALYKHYDDDLTGLSNNIINLTKDNKVVYQIFAMDSNTYTYKHGSSSYDYIHEDQINWYKDAIETVNKELNPSWTVGDTSTIPSLLFQHIPLPEMKDALNGYEIGTTINGLKYGEESCPPKYNSHFFDTIKEYKSTEAIFVGHDHYNNVEVEYEGIYFTYGVKSTDNMYHKEDQLGCRIVTIENLTSWSSEAKFYTY